MLCSANVEILAQTVTTGPLIVPVLPLCGTIKGDSSILLAVAVECQRWRQLSHTSSSQLSTVFVNNITCKWNDNPKTLLHPYEALRGVVTADMFHC